ncbi:sulfite reductase subunit A [candidate division GN15 bacterium]|uniref:Sulfite reductase subunit A n=1 Tax=candidate division GN15 bacterium TaxID=2072418 RepID=A0A855X9W5_9BACT|nr:MAG: sulfite reductase subunit A [candidate division GN15 bacterium]
MDGQFGRVVMARDGIDALIRLLDRQGFRVLGPTVKDAAVALAEISSTTDLPVGWTDAQDAASYRLVKHERETLFHYTVGAQSWKQFLYPSRTCLWRARRAGTELRIESGASPEQKMALFGVRSCDLHAIGIHDRVFAEGSYRDPGYVRRRSNMFVVAVNCSKAGATCFCTSMSTGPRATDGFDLCLTELTSPDGITYFVEAGSSYGQEMLAQLPSRTANEPDVSSVNVMITGTIRQMKRSLETAELKPLLQKNAEHRQWLDVGKRCLNCANCTMVCPTCFCVTVEDTTDLSGNAERRRAWDSCFTLDYSYIHGGHIRTSPQARYRQWLTHKLASWHDQFGSSGCVGCGRCITWCPVGIDITAEAGAIRKSVKIG